MAVIAKSGQVFLSTAIPPTNCQLSGLYAGAALSAGDACYIKTSDGKVYPSIGTAANAAAVVDGFTPSDVPIGEVVTLIWAVHLRYGAALSPGSFAYLDATTAGALNDTASTGGTTPIGRVVDTTRIYVQKSF
jgi:hypothetical protein